MLRRNDLGRKNWVKKTLKGSFQFCQINWKSIGARVAEFPESRELVKRKENSTILRK